MTIGTPNCPSQQRFLQQIYLKWGNLILKMIKNGIIIQQLVFKKN
ncbi:unnamed protein product [Paramecium sonneborni]|uniref:Uncharacterized protein n=1 Tax=Paramecium sonneborni TaxID=65129 RepID=A0A8S1RU92_9CILI|nr:unnamed protein product [Paramecium sonneborni]